jgi:hypothetical protein
MCESNYGDTALSCNRPRRQEIGGIATGSSLKPGKIIPTAKEGTTAGIMTIIANVEELLAPQSRARH